MLKFVCEKCGYVFVFPEAKLVKCFNPDCPKCGSPETTKIDKVARELTEYEMSQEE